MDTDQKRQVYEKGSFSFNYPVDDVIRAINETLDTKELDDYHLDMLGGLLTACRQYKADGEQQIPLSAAESMTSGLFNKRSADAKRREQKKRAGN